jgi:hypothetical protein
MVNFLVVTEIKEGANKVDRNWGRSRRTRGDEMTAIGWRFRFHFNGYSALVFTILG